MKWFSKFSGSELLLIPKKFILHICFQMIFFVQFPSKLNFDIWLKLFMSNTLNKKSLLKLQWLALLIKQAH